MWYGMADTQYNAQTSQYFFFKYLAAGCASNNNNMYRFCCIYAFACNALFANEPYSSACFWSHDFYNKTLIEVSVGAVLAASNK